MKDEENMLMRIDNVQVENRTRDIRNTKQCANHYTETFQCRYTSCHSR